MLGLGSNPIEHHELELPAPPENVASEPHALFLDFDGTLADFAPTPSEVMVAAHTVDTLEVLEGKLGGALAMVTGRPIAQLYEILKDYRPIAAGLHGHELQFAAEHTVSAAPPDDVIAAVRDEAHAISRRIDGVLVEDKGTSIALHYRANPMVGAIVVAAAEDLVAASDGHFVLQRGNLVAEMLPSGTDKGVAVRSLMRRFPFAGRIPVAVGDDFTDEHMFRAVHELGGYGIVVGTRRPTAARYMLRNPAEVAAWLGRLAT
jgi:trehalose 6-phosphate phosphatase